MPFDSLGLSAPLVKAAKQRGYQMPTPVQALAIPAILAGRDVLALAQTGSGKTAAFALPLLQKLQAIGHQKPRAVPVGVMVLVLVPTRELAVQVGEVFQGLAQGLSRSVKVAVLFGGVSVNKQMLFLRGGVEVVVATPGRLLDLLGSNALSLSTVQALVLDEADRLLDLGFAEELGRVLAALPAAHGPVLRQNLFFSATFPGKVQALAQTMLHDAVKIEIKAEPQTKPDILQRAIAVEPPQRTQLLRHLYEQNKWKRVLVFVGTKHAAEMVADKLRKVRINAEPFHGVLSQGKRSQVLADFKASRVKVVVATDVAARGLDIADLPVVVNFDLPRSAVDYTHRIGRTGRAGASGLAVSFVSTDMLPHWHLIAKRHQLDLQLEQIAGFEPVQNAKAGSAAETAVAFDMEAVLSNGGIKGKRPSKKDKLRAAAALSASTAPTQPLPPPKDPA